MQSSFAQARANSAVLDHANVVVLSEVWNTGRMAQGDLIAAIRAHKQAKARLDEARKNLNEAVRKAVTSGEWQIVDVVEVTGWSRETVRKIAYPKAKD